MEWYVPSKDFLILSWQYYSRNHFCFLEVLRVDFAISWESNNSLDKIIKSYINFHELQNASKS